uniref:Huntingtin interacting protein 1 n=1 Tax=Scleropages formosus TaxID=113540 RepID=A0A8C9V1S8_SCLFO
MCSNELPLSLRTVSINKAINTQEVAVKEKHARNILLGAHTFWAAANRLPLSSNAVLCWKFCHVFHKLLRDGHPNVIKDSMRNKADLSDMSRMWGHLSEGYGKLCSVYLKLLITKMEFHIKVGSGSQEGEIKLHWVVSPLGRSGGRSMFPERSL